MECSFAVELEEIQIQFLFSPELFLFAGLNLAKIKE